MKSKQSGKADCPDKNFLVSNKNGIIRTEFSYKIPPTDAGGKTD